MSRHNHTIAGAFVFLLLGIFAVSATVMVLLGVRFYRAQTERSAGTAQRRILSSYVRSMVRTADTAGVPGTDNIDGVEMLTLTENYDGWEYVTRIYTWDGSLREWFSDADYAFDPAQGEIICDAGAFHADMEDGLITVTIEDPDGDPVQARIAVRSGGAAKGA